MQKPVIQVTVDEAGDGQRKKEKKKNSRLL